ncbi:hypothetical protein HYU11_02030 [Candidatus Woesearchaeota archaeon]|nr:hypothetical protein [Candidatus Woesearchaeota archaeon]
MTSREKLASLVLRLGIAIVLLYSSISLIVQQESWARLSGIELIIEPESAILLFLLFQILLSLWLVSGIMIFEAAIVSAATLLLITLFNTGFFARDAAIISGSMALIVLNHKKNR